MFSKIYFKITLIVLILISIYGAFFYFIVIPNIQNNSMELEDKLGRAQLEKVMEVIKSSDDELNSYAEFALEVHKKELMKLTLPIWNLIEQGEKDTDSLSPRQRVEKQKELIELVEKLRYSDDGYFFISDYNSTLISHPYLHGQDFSKTKDMYGNLIVPPMVKIAQEEDSGYYTYWWRKNNTEQTIYEKLSFVKLFKPWKWVVGTGIYIDDIDEEIAHRKELLILRLKNILSTITIGESGYVYIFDSKSKMIIHPDKHLEGRKFDKMKNNHTNRYIFDDLITAYKSGDKKLYYQWDAPNDRGNFSYEKISWIDYNPYFDWYICSSGYVDEFHAKSRSLTNYLIYTTIFIAVFITLFSLFFLKNILVTPILKLSHISQKVHDGDLSVRYSGSVRNDEIGMLSLAYNQMLDTINTHIETLDIQVKERTQDLSDSLGEKEMLLRELHHRVKNNLFVISGIIGLQAFQEKEMSSHELIQGIQNRIQAIALVHELLSQDKTNATIHMQDYIEKLCDSLFLAFLYEEKSHHCEYDIENISLTLDQVYSVGLIVNELVTNAIKYAFTKDENFIKISLHRDKENNIVLQIEDHGPGFDPSISSGIGLEFVKMSVEQLDGTISFSSNHGTQIKIIFPILS